MKPKLKWLLTQKELREAANCYLLRRVENLDCNHCPVGNYCQDIGYKYLKKLMEYLITHPETMLCGGEGVHTLTLKNMLTELNKEYGK